MHEITSQYLVIFLVMILDGTGQYIIKCTGTVCSDNVSRPIFKTMLGFIVE